MRMSAFTVWLPTSELLIQDHYIRYLNTDAPYQHDYVTPYHLVAGWHVQSMLYECIFDWLQGFDNEIR